LKIETTPLDDHQVRLTVEIEADVLESSKRKAAKELAKKVKIPGFRPGKAPYNVIQKHVGDATIFENAIDIILDDIYPKVIEESKIDPYGPGKLEEIKELEPPTFEFLVPLAPVVKLDNYKDIRLDFEEKEITNEDVDKVIDSLRDNQAVIEPVDRSAEEGDMVYILLSGERKGEKDEKRKVLIEERSYPVIIEKESVDTASEYPYPGFSRNLIGMSPEEEKTLEYQFPDDYEFDDLQGATGVYKLKVQEVKGRRLPDAGDDFAKSIGDYENMEGLRAEITKSLKERTERDQNKEYEDKIIDKLLESAEIKHPPQMLDHEIDHFIQDLERQLASQGMNLEVYLKSREIDMEALREEIKPNAKERMLRALLISEIASQEEITLTQEEIEEKTKQTLSEIQEFYSEADAKKFTRGDVFSRLVNRIVSDEIIDRTLERLRIIAKGEAISDENEKVKKSDDDEIKESSPTGEDKADESKDENPEDKNDKT
jgi:trigger factor